MTTAITSAFNVFSNSLIMGEIAKYLEPSELGSLFSTSKQFFPLVTNTVSPLSLEQRRDFFASHHTHFFSRKITEAMTDKKLPPSERVKNIEWLLRCTSLDKKLRLFGQVSASINKANSPVIMMLERLIASLMPEREDLIGDLNLRQKSNHLYLDSAQVALFNHLRNYFGRSKRLDSVCMFEYSMFCAVALHMDEIWYRKPPGDLVNFVFSENISHWQMGPAVEFYSYVLSLQWEKLGSTVRGMMLGKINRILDKGGITLEIQKRTLYNLFYSRIHLNGEPHEGRISWSCIEIEEPIKKLIYTVEEQSSTKERIKVLNFLISNLAHNDTDRRWALSMIELFSQQKILGKLVPLPIKELAPLIPTFTSTIGIYLDDDLHRDKALDILEIWISQPMSGALKKEIFYNVHGLKSKLYKVYWSNVRNYGNTLKNNAHSWIPSLGNVDKILKKINATQIFFFYFDLDWLDIDWFYHRFLFNFLSGFFSDFLPKFLWDFKDILLMIALMYAFYE